MPLSRKASRWLVGSSFAMVGGALALSWAAERAANPPPPPEYAACHRQTSDLDANILLITQYNEEVRVHLLNRQPGNAIQPLRRLKAHADEVRRTVSSVDINACSESDAWIVGRARDYLKAADNVLAAAHAARLN